MTASARRSYAGCCMAAGKLARVSDMSLDSSDPHQARTRRGSRSKVPLREFLRYFLRLGTIGFGGPIALAAAMRRDLVEKRKWISAQEYSEGLAFSQLSPGPLAAQLAMYLGWIRAGTLGATLAGAAVFLPSFSMVVVLAALYLHYGTLAWIRGSFYGIGAAVIAIIARSAYKLVRATVQGDLLLWALFGVVAVTTAWTASQIVGLFFLSRVIPLVGKAPPPSSMASSASVFALPFRSLGL